MSYVCGRSFRVRLIRAACVYDEFSRNVMLPFKHAGALKYKNIMSRAMIGVLRELNTNIDIVMPVPLAYRRLWHRGYNQSVMLARPIAKYLKVDMDINAVRRKYRPDMGRKNIRQRIENIRGIFNVIHPDKVKGKSILLVDDVMTTGATLSELNRVLKKAGALNVYAVAFCRVVRAI